MKFVVLFLGIFISIASPCVSHAEDVLHVGGFSGLGTATDVADRQGFLEAENLTLEFERVDDSIELMTKFISGQYDIIQTNADSVIAWTEGQGFDKQTHDFTIVMGGYRGRAPLELVVSPEISSVEDLRGRVLAVDAIDTGYSTMLVYMLREEGLIWKTDYQLKSVGGGPMRHQAMMKGEIIGGLVPLNDELKQKGFHTLLSSRDYITDYARGVTAARRDWAEQNEELLVRYIRSMAGAINWLLDPRNKQAAIATIMEADEVSATEASQIYDKAVDTTFGFIPDAKIESAGIEQVLKLREVMGQMTHPLPSPDKYIESRFYQVAIDSLQDKSAAARGIYTDDLQRSTRIFAFQQAATDGPARGREIYYFSCWTCHNSYTVAAGTPAPLLEDLYDDSAMMMSGEPASDGYIADKIRNGGPLMPAFRHSLSDADIADLVSYIKSGQCCIASQEVNLPANPWYTASENDTMTFDHRDNLDGGPTGKVRSTDDVPLEGIMVQLIASQNNIRTTVYSNEAGEYEFPKLPVGAYTLRIARPLRWQPYRRNNVHIDGASQLDEIVLRRVTEGELLPPTLDIMGQMSGAEWLFNLPGTMEEKRLFVKNCNWCHSYQQIFRSRFDEHGWRRVIDRMSHYQGSTLTYRNSSGRMEPDQEETVVQWLARVRGPESTNPHFKVMPYPTGPATEVIVTEYELPRLYLATHDVAQDADAHLWYSPHRGPRVGQLDPTTGITREHYVPVPDGCIPGTHWITVTKDNKVWGSQNWAHLLTRIDPKTGDMHQIKPPPRLRPDGTPRPCNMSMGGNWAVAPDGYIWKVRTGMVVKTDPETGKYVQTWPVKNVKSTYGTDVTDDGKFVGGGAWGEDWMILLDIEMNEVVERLSSYPNQGPGRSAFDNTKNNLWSGGKGGALVRLETSTRRLKEFVAPLLYYGSFYEANADKNGDIWAGAVQTGRYSRLNPETEQWINYVLPEPYSHNRKSWIDDTTDPVSLWYVDHNSFLVHIQPRK